MTITLIIEIVVGALLIATCTYCYVLSRRLRAIQNGQAELLNVLGRFDDASRRAEHNLEQMQNCGLTLERDLSGTADRAEHLMGELSVMVNAGDNIAGRIEEAINEVRAIGAKRQVRPHEIAS